MAETKGFSLADMLMDVSNLDTGANPAAAPQQIELVPLDLIDQDPNNFYSLDGIDQLAASIELVGLQQPILVRPSGGGRYVVISGHRRRAAAMLIRDGGSKQFEAGLPCIVDRSEASEALRELQLIYANSDTRVLTSAELGRQAERVEMLLYELKEQGVDFPGRMRDHVAEACKLSKTKLARLKVIRDKLDPCFKPYYDKGVLSESAAYALAQKPTELQKAMKKFEASRKNDIKYLNEGAVRTFADFYTPATSQKCKINKLSCSHVDKMLEKLSDDYWAPCRYDRCCDKCSKLASCKYACPELAEKVKKLKADNKAAQQQEKLAQEKRNSPHIEFIGRVWQRFGAARESADLSIKQIQKKMQVSWYGELSDENKIKAWERGTGKISIGTKLPFGWGLTYDYPESIVQLADILGCSTDYLLGRTEQMTLAAAPAQLASQWQTGTPQEAGEYIIYIFDGVLYEVDSAKYSPDTGWKTGSWLSANDIKGWLPMPEDPYDD